MTTNYRPNDWVPEAGAKFEKKTTKKKTVASVESQKKQTQQQQQQRQIQRNHKHEVIRAENEKLSRAAEDKKKNREEN